MLLPSGSGNVFWYGRHSGDQLYFESELPLSAPGWNILLWDAHATDVREAVVGASRVRNTNTHSIRICVNACFRWE